MKKKPSSNNNPARKNENAGASPELLSRLEELYGDDDDGSGLQRRVTAPDAAQKKRLAEQEKRIQRGENTLISFTKDGFSEGNKKDKNRLLSFKSIFTRIFGKEIFKNAAENNNSSGSSDYFEDEILSKSYYGLKNTNKKDAGENVKRAYFRRAYASVLTALAVIVIYFACDIFLLSDIGIKTKKAPFPQLYFPYTRKISESAPGHKGSGDRTASLDTSERSSQRSASESREEEIELETEDYVYYQNSGTVRINEEPEPGETQKNGNTGAEEENPATESESGKTTNTESSVTESSMTESSNESSESDTATESGTESQSETESGQNTEAESETSCV